MINKESQVKNLNKLSKEYLQQTSIPRLINPLMVVKYLT